GHAEGDEGNRRRTVDDVDQAAEQAALDDPDAEEARREDGVEQEDDAQDHQRPYRAVAGQRAEPGDQRSLQAQRRRTLDRHPPAIVWMILSCVRSAPAIS